MNMKTGLAALVTALLLLPGIAQADELPMKAEAPITLTSPSAILCEASTGQVIFEKNADERRPVASVNKVMTILLTLEAVDEGRVSLEDQVTVSPRAASMGGSQAFLDAGERYKLSELLKTVIVASANDSAVALAEHRRARAVAEDAARTAVCPVDDTAHALCADDKHAVIRAAGKEARRNGTVPVAKTDFERGKEGNYAPIPIFVCFKIRPDVR